MAVIGNKAYKYEGTEINPCKGKKELNLSSDESLLFIQDLTVKFYNCVLKFLNLWGAFFDRYPFVIGKKFIFYMEVRRNREGL